MYKKAHLEIWKSDGIYLQNTW